MYTFFQRSYHRKCQHKGIENRKKPKSCQHSLWTTPIVELIAGLKFDNADLVSKVAEIEKELVDSQDKITVLKVQLESSSNVNQTQSSPPVKILSKMSLSNSRANNALPLNTTEARIQTGFYFMFSLMNFLKIMVKSLFILLWLPFLLHEMIKYKRSVQG